MSGNGYHGNKKHGDGIQYSQTDAEAWTAMMAKDRSSESGKPRCLRSTFITTVRTQDVSLRHEHRGFETGDSLGKRGHSIIHFFHKPVHRPLQVISEWTNELLLNNATNTGPAQTGKTTKKKETDESHSPSDVLSNIWEQQQQAHGHG